MMFPTDTTTTSCMSRSDCLDRLQGMLNREETVYSSITTSSLDVIASKDDEEEEDNDYAVLRRSIVEVFEEIFDQCHLENRETVAVAISFLDRFMQSQSTTTTPTSRFVNVPLAAATCLYLAVKTNEPTVIPPAMLCEVFARSLDCEDDEEEEHEDDEQFDARDLEAMELVLMKALNYNLNPPTSMMFVSHILACLPFEHSSTWVESAEQVARIQLEVAQRSNSSTQFPASTLAAASLFTAFESLPTNSKVSMFKSLLQAVRRTEPEQQRQVLKAQALLKSLVVQASEATDMPSSKKRVQDTAAAAVTAPPSKKQRLSNCFTESPRSTLPSTMC